MSCIHEMNGFVNFCKNVKLTHPMYGETSFTLRPYQKTIAEALEREDNVIVNKFRGGGFSTLALVFALYKCLNGKKILILSTSIRESQEKAKILQKMLFSLPNVPFVEKITSTEIFLASKGRITFCTDKEAVGYDFVIVDEAAFMSNITPPLNCKYFVLSTPNGRNNWFYKTCVDAMYGNNKFKYLEFNCLCSPEYSKEWKEKVEKQLGKEGFLQEMMCSFGPEANKYGKAVHPLDIPSDIINKKYYEKYCYEDDKQVFLVGEKDVVPEVMPVLTSTTFDTNDPILEDQDYLCNTKEDVYLKDQDWFSGDNISKVWEDISNNMPDFTDAKKMNQKKILTNTDCLKLAGIPQENDYEEVKSWQDLLAEALENILPKGVEVSFSDYLCLNGIPTKVYINSLEKVYYGLRELVDAEEALRQVKEIVKKKFELVF